MVATSALEPLDASLLERGRELSAIDRALGEAAAGRGRLLLVEGPAGIGKTTLVKAAVALARERGLPALTGHGAPLEREFSYGTVRQLFEPVRVELGEQGWERLFEGAAAFASRAFGPDEQGSGIAREEVSYSTLHGLYWLTTNLAAQRPLVLAVDDCHWVDAPSLRYLCHLVERLDDLPALVLAAVRTGDPASDPELIDHLTAAGGEPLRPRALGEAAAARLVRAELGDAATQRFCGACHAATGGNPFLLNALLRSLAAEGVRPDDDAADRVTTFGTEAVARALAVRIARLHPAAGDIARAVAVLGGGSALHHVAALAGVSADEALVASDTLRAAGILDPGPGLEFAHPLARAAVYEAIPHGERAAAHGRAAALLAGEDAPADRLALHLLHVHPRGDRATAATLHAAARIAADRGAPETAAAYLRRALAEPAQSEQAGPIQLELGLAGLAWRRAPEAPRLLREAIDRIGDAAGRDEAALLAGRALGIAGYFTDAVSVLEAALAGGRSPGPKGLLVEAELIGNASVLASASARARELLARHDPADRPDSLGADLMLVNHGFRSMCAGEPAEVAARLVERGFASGRLLGKESIAVTLGLVALIVSDQSVDLVERLVSELVREGERRGYRLAVAHYVQMRSLAALRRGALADAEADARSAYEYKLGMGSPVAREYPLNLVVDALVERGELELAEHELGRSGITEMPVALGSALLTEATGRLRLAQGRFADAVAELEEAGRHWEAIGVRSAVVTRWRADAALALARLGDDHEARRLAAGHLDLARGARSPRAIGVALRVAGALERGSGGADVLREAAAVLEGTSARLELAYALVDLGGALRRAGARKEACEHLRRGLELAHRSGAAPLAERARDELLAARARPRRPVFTGVEALTAGERRVARLAAEGRSNREIAQALFVTQRTVETHLQHAFQKLGIASRTALPAELRG